MQLSELITAADECLSRAISRGGNKVTYDDDPVQDQAMPAEADTENPDEAVFVMTKPSTLAKNGHLLHGNDLEVEEIEIFTPGFQFDHFGAAGKKAAEIQCRSEAVPGRVSDPFAGPVPGVEAVMPAPAAAHEEYGVPDQPRAVPPAEWAVIPADFEKSVETELSSPADDEDISVVLTPLFADTAAGRTGHATAPADTGRVLPRNSNNTNKPARHTRRPGILKRMLVWLGLVRSHK
jgi:hypothetical protein